MNKLVISKQVFESKYKIVSFSQSFLDLKRQNRLLRETIPLALYYDVDNYIPFILKDNITDEDLDKAFAKLEKLWKQDCQFKNSCNVYWNLARSSGNLYSKYMIVGLNPGFGDYLKTGEWGTFWTGTGIPTITLRSALQRLDILKDSWITNLCRCSTKNNDVPGLQEIDRCYNNWLLNEINVIQPEKIFVLGNDTFNLISKYRDDIIKVKHPAYFVRRGIKDEYYKEFEKYL